MRVMEEQLGGFRISSRRRHTRFKCDWSSDVCSSDLVWYCVHTHTHTHSLFHSLSHTHSHTRSEERRGGKECRSRWSPYHSKKIYNEQMCIHKHTIVDRLLSNDDDICSRR